MAGEWGEDTRERFGTPRPPRLNEPDAAGLGTACVEGIEACAPSARERILAREARPRALTAARRTPDAASEECSDGWFSSCESAIPDAEDCDSEAFASEASASFGLSSDCEEVSLSGACCGASPTASLGAGAFCEDSAEFGSCEGSAL